jgi:hypothetical protein
MMPSPLLDLHEINCRLHFLIDRMATMQGAAAGPAQLEAMLSELLRVGEWLRAQALQESGPHPELDSEIGEYRRNLEKLGALLPSLHVQLLAERARLEAERARVHSVGEWVRASRQTL